MQHNITSDSTKCNLEYHIDLIHDEWSDPWQSQRNLQIKYYEYVLVPLLHMQYNVTSDSTKCDLEYHIDLIHEMNDLIRGNGNEIFKLDITNMY